jgi:hypothetical protein
VADPGEPVLNSSTRALCVAASIGLLLAASVTILLAASGMARRFYPDDPLAAEPPDISVGELRTGAVDNPTTILHDAMHQPTGTDKRTPSLDTNTIDEIPDGDWFTNRHYRHPLTDAELARGPGGNEPPAIDRPWTIYEANEGMSPIFRIEDSRGHRFALRFDPKDHIELTTGADVVGSHLFHALGYNVPDDYAIRFRREQLHVGDNIHFVRDGQRVLLREADLDHLLSLTPRYPDGSHRALASRLIEGKLLGPFSYSGTREDDPNDIVPHERRRVLRALFIFNSWIDHVDTGTLGTLDTIQVVPKTSTGSDGIRAVRHYLADFGSSFGSGRLRPKEAWEGHTYAVDLRWGLREMLTLGAYSPKWERAKPVTLPAAGQYEGESFDPAGWKPTYPNPAFDGRDDADGFWAAKQIAAFTDDQLRTIVASGQYSDPKTVEAIVRTMIVRRDKIAAFYFARTVPLDRFEVRDSVLRFHDSGGSGHYNIGWSRYDNGTDVKSDLETAPSLETAPRTFSVPRDSAAGATGYLAADIGDGTHQLTVYLHDGRVVGVTRH